MKLKRKGTVERVVHNYEFVRPCIITQYHRPAALIPSLTVYRRQLPQIPAHTLSDGNKNPAATIRPNTSYQTTSSPLPDQLNDVYDNENVYDNDEKTFKSRSERYSRLQRNTASTKPHPTVTPPKSTVIANSETYDTVVDTQSAQLVQEVYDIDPFERDPQSIVRRDSNPNIYSDVNAQITPKLSRPISSLVVNNPGTTIPTAATSKQAPPLEADAVAGCSSGEEYEDMSTSDLVKSLTSPPPGGPITLARPKAADPEPKSSNPEPKSSKPEPKSSEPKPYFEFTNEYDTIINQASEEKKAKQQTETETKVAETNAAEAKATETKTAEAKAADDRSYLQFTDEYDTIIHTAKEEALIKKGAVLDREGAESQGNYMTALSGEPLIK